MVDRILDWLHQLDVRRAGRVVPISGGAVLLHDGFPEAYDHNKVEEIVTEEAYRGRGLATLLVTEATRRAQRAGAEQVFLIPDADDWPKDLYRTLGYQASQILPTYSRHAATKVR